jgi:hypothetical protein
VLLAASLIAACGQVGQDRIILPEAGGAQSVILLVQEGTAASFHAFPIDREFQLATASPDFGLLAFFYQPSLEDLGLQKGLIPAGPDCRRSCALADPEQSLAYEGQGRWSASDDAPALVRAKLLPDFDGRCGPCVPFQAEEYLPWEGGEVRFLVGGEADRALVGYRDGAILELDPFGAAEVICQAEGLRAQSAFLAADGQLFVTDIPTSQMWRLDLNAPTVGGACVVEEAVPIPPDHVRWMAGDPSGAEIYMLTKTGALGRIDDNGFELVTQLETADSSSTSSHGGLIWLGPGEVLAGFDNRHVTRVRGGEIQTESLRLDSVRVDALGFSPTFGPLVGLSRFALVAQDESGAWTTLAEGGGRLGVGSILGSGDSIFLTRSEGIFNQYTPEVGYCQERVIFGSQRASKAVLLEPSGVIVVGDGEGLTDNQPDPRAVVLLRPRRTCGDGP